MQYNCTRITLAFYMYKIVIVNGPLLQRYETKKKSVCWMIHEVPPPQVGQWTLCPQTHNAVERHINFWTREFQGEQWNFKSWCIHLSLHIITVTACFPNYLVLLNHLSDNYMVHLALFSHTQILPYEWWRKNILPSLLCTIGVYITFNILECLL